MKYLQNKKIAVVVSTPMTAFVFLSHQLQVLAENNQVTLIADFSNHQEFFHAFPNINVVDIGISRNINLLSDVSCLWRLYKYCAVQKFDIVHSVSPKAGLLAMLASAMALCKVRLHTFTGQVWVTRTGFSRLLLKAMDRLIVFCTTFVIVDSHSQREFLLREGVVKRESSTVLASGSISGVDKGRFYRREDCRQLIRSRYNVGDSDILLLFLGRLKIDKGVIDLAQAFNQVAIANHRIKLIYVGPDEEGLEGEIRLICSSVHDRLFFVPYTNSPEDYMSAADCFCLPSYREGFGSVVIEAASCSLPTIASNIYGLCDAVDHDRTGILVAPRDISALRKAIDLISRDEILRISLGDAAKSRADALFSHQLLTRELMGFYVQQFS